MEGKTAGNPEGVAWDEGKSQQAVQAAGGDAAASAARELLGWSKRGGLCREFACKSRGPQCLIKLHKPPRGITLLHTEADAKRSWLGMQWLRNHASFDREDVQAEWSTGGERPIPTSLRHVWYARKLLIKVRN